jgi:intracellular sulfur oxidation DsrE/DsrF family protein
MGTGGLGLGNGQRVTGLVTAPQLPPPGSRIFTCVPPSSNPKDRIVPDSPSPRRQFVGRVVGGAAALAAAPLLPLTDAAAAGQGSGGVTPSQSPWDMSWVDRIRGEHRMVFDSPDITDGLVLVQSRNWLAANAEVYGLRDDQMTAVLVIRHAGVPMVLNDAMWEKYNVAKAVADRAETTDLLKDPTTGEPTRRNPFINLKPDDRHVLVYGDGGLDRLIARGVVVLACNLALRNMSGSLARQASRPAADVFAEVKANLLPGVTVMPNGIFAVGRAQGAGCGFIRST